MTITDFASLLAAARAQTQPQRLLFVFCKAVLHDDATPAERERFANGVGGILLPAMCVDKSPQELSDFAALAAEAAQMGEPWRIVFVAAIEGQSSQDADAPIKRMIQTIQTGGDVARYLAFDTTGRAVSMG